MNCLSLKNAAKILGISPSMIQQWEKKKLIKSQKISQGKKVFNLEELQALQNKNTIVGSDNNYNILQSQQEVCFNVIELFAGCGGMALGFENAGLQTKLLVEIDKNCVNTLKINRPNWRILHDNVTNIDFKHYRDRVDIVAGGFPCQAFSYAGHGKGFEDTRGTLFFEFARCLSEVRPKIAIAENVRGLLSHQNGETLAIMLKTLKNLGYNVEYKLLSAQFLDVPQKRERVIILATRKDLQIRAIFPQEKNYTISLREALQDCPKSRGVQYKDRKREIMELVPPGGNWRDLPVEIQKEYLKNSFYKGGGRTGFAKRLSWDEPALTVTCSPAQTQTERCHPDETRPLTVREYARIQTFPDRWQFTGSLSAQYRQIGNAVPVNMAYHLGQGLITMLRGFGDQTPTND
ncbi:MULTISPECIES: DNA (cytosine-5-)-methyltransferase [Spirulina sp. CCY15215]|uniref:DNA (cytosine-5-)-methyltransferase n=1 Tax=Spirulina sp. CCY15215 TaxID=2767591 RepID=UPI00194F66ED